MRRLISAYRCDLTLQYRRFFYHVYAVVTAVYILVARFTPLEYRPLLLSLTIFTDPAIFGPLFVAALVLYEKDAHSLEAIRVTPLRAAEYLWAKALSLSTLALAASLALALASGVRFNPFLLAIGVSMTATTHVLLGFAVAVRCNNLSVFIVRAIPVISVLSLPVFTLLSFWGGPGAYLIPGQAGLDLITQAFAAEPNWAQAVSVIALLGGWNAVTYLVAKREHIRFSRLGAR